MWWTTAIPATPHEAANYQLEDPHGLDVQGSELYVCDGDAGLKTFDASNAPQLDEEGTIGGIDGYDVIALPHSLIVVGEDGIHQYDRDQGLQELSSISAGPC